MRSCYSSTRTAARVDLSGESLRRRLSSTPADNRGGLWVRFAHRNSGMNTETTTRTMNAADALAMKVYEALGGHASRRAQEFADLVRLVPEAQTCGVLLRRVEGIAAGFRVSLS